MNISDTGFSIAAIALAIALISIGHSVRDAYTETHIQDCPVAVEYIGSSGK